MPVGRFSAGVGSSVPDKFRLPPRNKMKIWRRLSDMASCLISANQDLRKTTQTGSKLKCGGEEKPCVCLGVGVRARACVFVSVCMLVCV